MLWYLRGKDILNITNPVPIYIRFELTPDTTEGGCTIKTLINTGWRKKIEHTVVGSGGKGSMLLYGNGSKAPGKSDYTARRETAA